MSTKQKYPNRKPIIKMNSKTVRELRSIAKYKVLRGYYKLKKDDLVALLLEESAQEMPSPLPRTKGKKRRFVLPAKIIPGPQEMNEFEKKEIEKSRPVVKNRLNKWCNCLIHYVLKTIKNAVSKIFSKAKNSILRLYDSAKKTLMGDIEDEAEKENQENQEEGEEEDVDLTPHEHERALKGACRSFVIARKPKTDIDSFFDQTKLYIKALIEDQLKKIQSAKIIMTLWV